MKRSSGDKRPVGLYLDDGTFFAGKWGFGSVSGSVVVVDSSGFVEAATDSAAEGLILCFTFPQAGFAPVALREVESQGSRASGVIISQIARTKRGEMLKEYFRKQEIALLEGVDTRALALHLSAKPVSGVIYTGVEIQGTAGEPLTRTTPNRGARVAVLGELTHSLGRNLLDLGCELIEYEDVPAEFFQIDAVVLTKALENDQLQALASGSVPVIALGRGAHSFAVSFGGQLRKSPLFAKNLAVEDLRSSEKRILSAEFRLKETVVKAPGKVVFLEHLSRRPVGFAVGSAICLEFLPDKELLKELLERRWFSC